MESERAVGRNEKYSQINRQRADFEKRRSRLQTKKEQTMDQWQTEGKSQLKLTVL